MTLDAVFGADAERDLRYLTEVRGVIGDDLALVVDVPGAQDLWDVPTAIRRLREWERFDLRWVEQPLHRRTSRATGACAPRSPRRSARARTSGAPRPTSASSSPTASTCSQLDPGRCLGLTGCREVVKQVEIARVRYSAHSWSSALNTAASLHMLAISERGDTLDFKPHESPMQHDVVEDPWAPAGGMLALRSAPGLGVTVREDAVARYLFE